MHAVEIIFRLSGFDDAHARVVVILPASGFIPTLMLAWAFELPPGGLKKGKDIDSSRSITPQTGKKPDRLIRMALAPGCFAFDKTVLEPRP